MIFAAFSARVSGLCEWFDGKVKLSQEKWNRHIAIWVQLKGNDRKHLKGKNFHLTMDCHENQPMLLCHCDHVRASSESIQLWHWTPRCRHCSRSREEAPLKRRFSADESKLLIDFCVFLLAIVFESFEAVCSPCARLDGLISCMLAHQPLPACNPSSVHKSCFFIKKRKIPDTT